MWLAEWIPTQILHVARAALMFGILEAPSAYMVETCALAVHDNATLSMCLQHNDQNNLPGLNTGMLCATAEAQ